MVLTWNATPSAAWEISYILIGGTDITNVFVGHDTALTTTGTKNVTGVGFQGDAFFFLHGQKTAGGTNAHAATGLGFALSSSKQWAWSGSVYDAQTTSANVNGMSVIRSNACLLGQVVTSNSDDFVADFTQSTADGFDLNFSNGAASAYLFSYLVIKGGSWDGGVQAKPTGATAQTVTGMAFQPKLLACLMSSPTALATYTSEATLTFGAATGASARGYAGAFHNDAINTVAKSAGASTRILRELNYTAEADFTSFNADGWTITWDAAGSAYQVPWFAATGPAAGGDLTLPLTGVAATGSPGTLTPQTSAPLAGVAGTGAVGTVAPQVSLPLAGVLGTGAVGAVAPQASVALAGVAATGAVGTVAPQSSAPLTGVAATGAVGTVTASISGDLTLPLTGVAGTGAVGAVAPQLSVPLTGVAGAGAVGSVGIGAALSGVSATGSPGTLAPQASAPLTGVLGTGAVGTVAPQTSIPLTGVLGTGAVGTVAPQVSVALLGVAGTGAVGTVGPQASIALLGVAGTGAAGTASPAISKALTGVAATGAVGTVTASIGGDLTLPLTGVAAAGSVGGVAPQTSVALTGVAPTAAVGELTAGVLRPAGMRPGAGPGTVRGSPHMASRTADSPDSSRAADLPGSNRGADIPTSKRS
jgi:hypothetical protein